MWPAPRTARQQRRRDKLEDTVERLKSVIEEMKGGALLLWLH